MQKTGKMRSSQFRQPRPGHESQISPVPACSRLALAALGQKHESQSGLSASSESKSGHAECHKLCRHATPSLMSYNTAAPTTHDHLPCHNVTTQISSLLTRTLYVEATAHDQIRLKHCITFFLTLTVTSTINSVIYSLSQHPVYHSFMRCNLFACIRYLSPSMSRIKIFHPDWFIPITLNH